MKTVLIIEDDIDILENIKDVLEQQDYQTITAIDSSLGVRLARKSNPDLVLCDVLMPKLDGFGVLAEMRHHQATATTPLIFVTGKSERAEVRRGMDLGADDYLTKPFTTSELLSAVSSCINKQEHLARQYSMESQTAKLLAQQVRDYQELAEASYTMCQRMAQDLRHPFSNINIALHLVRGASSEAERDRLLRILQEECTRGTAVLNEAAGMQEFLSLDKFNVLRQLKMLNSTRVGH